MSNTLKKFNILITGAGGPAGINALRLLRPFAEVVRTIAVDCDELSAGRFFADEFRVIAKVNDFADYERDLNHLIKEFAIDCLLPTVAEELAMIHQAVKDFNGLLLASPVETLALCHDKKELYQWAEKEFPEYMVKWFSLAGTASFSADNYFIKPAIGRGSRGCRLITASELTYIKEFEAEKDYIVMENIPGTEWTVDVYINADGSFAFVLPRERVGLSGGISAKGRTKRNQPLMEMTKELSQKLKIRGPVCIQWKQASDGSYKLIEINPRLSGGAAITAAAGADPMRCLLAELQGKPLVDIVWQEVTVIRYFDEKILK